MARFLPACLAIVTVLLSTNSFVHAGQEVYTETQVVEPVSEFPFEKGNFELQVLGGAFFSFNHEPDLNYAIGTVRGGWMLYTPYGQGICRGNVEFLIEAFGGGIFDGPGDVLAGATLLLRYNFVQPNAVVVPYFQIGGGGVYSDAADDENQRLIGSDFSFNLQASIGARFFLSDRCAFVVEGGYRHISNANTADRNTGLDSLGGHIGVSWFF